jgi:hypothetical protein
MKILSSLRSRIFLASAVLAVLCIGMAIYLVSAQVTEEAERTLERQIIGTGAQFDQLRTERTQTFTMMARFIADLPKLKAAVETNDPTTVSGIAKGYQSTLDASLVLLTNKKGEVLYAAGGSPRIAEIAAHQPAVREALAGRDSLSLLPQPNGILQVVTVPVTAVTLDRPHPEMLGTLSAGFLLDEAFANQLKQITGSDIAFGMDGQILAARRVLFAGGSAAIVRHLARSARRRRVRSAAAPAIGGRRSRTVHIRTSRADPALAHRAVARPRDDSQRAGRHRRSRHPAGDAPQLRGRADDHATARRHHRRHARGRGDRRPDAEDRRPPQQPVGRRGRAATGHDVQHADRFDLALPA